MRSSSKRTAARVANTNAPWRCASPAPSQVADRVVDRVAGVELVGALGHLTDDLLDRPLGGMRQQQQAEDGLLQRVLALGHRPLVLVVGGHVRTGHSSSKRNAATVGRDAIAFAHRQARFDERVHRRLDVGLKLLQARMRALRSRRPPAAAR